MKVKEQLLGGLSGAEAKGPCKCPMCLLKFPGGQAQGPRILSTAPFVPTSMIGESGCSYISLPTTCGSSARLRATAREAGIWAWRVLATVARVTTWMKM